VKSLAPLRQVSAANRSLAENQPSDEATTDGDDVVSLLSFHLSRVAGNGKRVVLSDNLKNGSEHNLVRNFTEEAVIAALDGNRLDKGIQELVEILWACRKKGYATFRAAPPIDQPGPVAVLRPKP
jgi:hypothetical protein